MKSCFYIIYDIIPIHLPVIPAFMFMQINLKTWDLNHGGEIAAKIQRESRKQQIQGNSGIFFKFYGKI